MSDTIVVICVRDPDYSNEYTVVGGNVEIIDVDLGVGENSPSRKNSYMLDVQRLREDGLMEAADQLLSILDGIEWDGDCEDCGEDAKNCKCEEEEVNA